MDAHADGIVNSIGNRGGRINDSCFADALGAVGSGGKIIFDEDIVHIRHVHDIGYTVGEQAVGQNAPCVRIDGKVFSQCEANALHGAALHLRFDELRIDSAANVVCDNILHDADETGLGIDIDLSKCRLMVGVM